MTDTTPDHRRRWPWPVALIVVIAAVLFTPPARQIADRFLASLRIARPQPVAVNLPAVPGATYRIQELVTGMLADSASTEHDEPGRTAATPSAASTIAGFALHLPRTRLDTPAVSVTGAHDVTVAINRARFRTILDEAGKSGVVVPPAVEGAVVTMHTPAAVVLRYGHCPAPAPATLATQVQGPPPPPPDVGDCIELTETPQVVATAPSGVAFDQLVEIALELSGLSPERAATFQRQLDWRSTLALSLPRFVRSFDTVTVAGAPGLLFGAGGRRGPSYVLVWAKSGIVYALTGYGNSADGVAAANAIN